MYHSSSNLKYALTRLAVYSLMTALVIGMVVGLIFIVLGYRVDVEGRRITQGGLVQLNSTPRLASVSMNGQDIGTRTPNKVTMDAADYFVTMKLAGYHPWQKAVSVKSGMILWLNYARLIPLQMTVENAAEFQGVASSLVSPSRRRMAVIEEAATPLVRVANLETTIIRPTTVELPPDSYTKPAPDQVSRFELAAWDGSSRTILILHTVGKKREFIRLDVDSPANTKNISRLLNVNMEKVVFSGSNRNMLYALIDGDVRRIDLSSETISRPLARDVETFSQLGDTTIIFTTKLDPESKQRGVGYYDEGAENARLIKTYTDDGTTSLRFAAGEYYQEPYLAVAYGRLLEVMHGTLPSSDSVEPLSLQPVTSIVLKEPASFLSVRTSGRFVVAQTGNSVSVYDNELDKFTVTDLKTPQAPTSEINWLDGYTFWGAGGGTVRLYEFDGSNQHDIMPAMSEQAVTLSPNGEFLYAFNKDTATGKTMLVRVRLVLL